MSVVEQSVCIYDIAGVVLHEWPLTRPTDICITADGKRLYAVQAEKSVICICVDTGTSAAVYTARWPIASLGFDRHALQMLLYLSAEVILLVDVASKRVVQRFYGHLQGRYIVHSCFCGHEREFVASGSEDNHVYMWKRSSGKLVSTMEGHGGIVSAIAWNSVDGVLATGSDDKGVRVWGDPK